MAARYWTHSWNPVTGCEPVGPACERCWAAGMCRRFGHLHGWRTVLTVEGETNDVEARPFDAPALHPERLLAPPHFPIGSVVATCWLGDLFWHRVRNDWRRAVIRAIDESPYMTYLLLSKRLGAATDYLTAIEPRTYIWMGFSAWDDESVKVAIDHAHRLRDAGWHTWLSLEPLLESLSVSALAAIGSFESVVVGGETGAGARIMSPSWALDVERAADQAGVPLFFKQWGTAMDREIRAAEKNPGKVWPSGPGLWSCMDTIRRLPERQAVGWPQPLGGTR